MRPGVVDAAIPFFVERMLDKQVHGYVVTLGLVRKAPIGLRHTQLGIARALVVGKVVGIGFTRVEHHATRNGHAARVAASRFERIVHSSWIADIIDRGLQLAVGDFGARIPPLAECLSKPTRNSS